MYKDTLFQVSYDRYLWHSHICLEWHKLDYCHIVYKNSTLHKLLPDLAFPKVYLISLYYSAIKKTKQILYKDIESKMESRPLLIYDFEIYWNISRNIHITLQPLYNSLYASTHILPIHMLLMVNLHEVFNWYLAVSSKTPAVLLCSLSITSIWDLSMYR